MLGSVIATLAIFLRIELFLPILCGLFFLETITVILQVLFFKYTRKKTGQGKKLFLLSPLHYHLIKKGWPEVNTTARFTIISILLAVVTIFLLI
jgi:phospho-N-acetylmuramoyl-pentapeptide-transferase